MFLSASNVEWLFAARITQGIATGVVTSALAASLVDLQPAEHPTLAPVVNSSTPILALALGALTSAALVQYAPDPLYLVFWLLLTAFVGAGVAIALIPEPTTWRRAVHLVPQVGVEAHVRPGFVGGASDPGRWLGGRRVLSLSRPQPCIRAGRLAKSCCGWIRDLRARWSRRCRDRRAAHLAVEAADGGRGNSSYGRVGLHRTRHRSDCARSFSSPRRQSPASDLALRGSACCGAWSRSRHRPAGPRCSRRSSSSRTSRLRCPR